MLRFLFLTTCVASMVGGAQPVFSAEPPKTYVLPNDPQAVVIELNYAGGFTPPRKNNDPTMTIRTNGTVTLGAPWGQRKRIETKIEQAELQELLRYLLDEQKLAGFDGNAVRAAVKAEQQKQGGLAFAVADAPTLELKIHADGKQTAASYYALSMDVGRYPAVKELAQLEAARKRLERLRNEIYAGGKKGVAKHLELANKQLKADHPQVPALVDGDLQMAWQLADGKTTTRFSRTEELDSGEVQSTSATVNMTAAGKADVSTNVSVRPMR